MWHNRSIRPKRFPEEVGGEPAGCRSTSEQRRGGVRPSVASYWTVPRPTPVIRGDKAVMEFLDGATHDEIAVITCLAAMVGSIGLMLLSGTAFGNSPTVDGKAGERVRGEVSRRVGSTTADQDAA